MKSCNTWASLLLAMACAFPAMAQTEADSESQMLTNLDAMIIGARVTMRCALYDSTLAYLTPLEAAAVDIRKREVKAALEQTTEGLAEQMSAMREEADAIACGSAGLEPFLDFNRQVARDVTDIAIAAWDDIDIAACVYFADDDFMDAAERARAADTTPDPAAEPGRAAYIAQMAQAWVKVFDDNCYNLAFEPALTLPGLVALALPTQ